MCVILMMIDIAMHRQGRVTWQTTRFLLIKLFCQLFCICYWVVVLAIWSSMVQMLKILTDTYISHIVCSQFALKDVIERYFWNGLTRKWTNTLYASKAMKVFCALYGLYIKYASLSWKTYTCWKSKILNLKPHCIYSLQSIEHYYCETEEQNSNGCKLLVKKDAILDSLDAKECSYDNSTNCSNFTNQEGESYFSLHCSWMDILF